MSFFRYLTIINKQKEDGYRRNKKKKAQESSKKRVQLKHTGDTSTNTATDTQSENKTVQLDHRECSNELKETQTSTILGELSASSLRFLFISFLLS